MGNSKKIKTLNRPEGRTPDQRVSVIAWKGTVTGTRGAPLSVGGVSHLSGEPRY